VRRFLNYLRGYRMWSDAQRLLERWREKWAPRGLR